MCICIYIYIKKSVFSFHSFQLHKLVVASCCKPEKGSELNRGWFLRDSCWLCLRCCRVPRIRLGWLISALDDRVQKFPNRSRVQPMIQPPLLSNFQPTRPDPEETLSSWMKRAYVWISFSLCTPRIDFRTMGIPGHELQVKIRKVRKVFVRKSKGIVNGMVDALRKFRTEISKGLFKRERDKDKDKFWKLGRNCQILCYSFHKLDNGKFCLLRRRRFQVFII